MNTEMILLYMHFELKPIIQSYFVTFWALAELSPTVTKYEWIPERERHRNAAIRRSSPLTHVLQILSRNMDIKYAVLTSARELLHAL